MGFSYELHHSAKKNSYSSPRLVVDRMEELIVELLLVENVWCQKQSWSFMNLLCSGMVGFGLRRNLGTAEKEPPSPLFPLRWSERYWRSSSVKVKGTICLRSDWSITTVPLRPSEGEEWGRGALFSVVPKFRRRPKLTIQLHSKFINDKLCFWHHTFSTNSSSTISSSILSTY